MCCVLNGSCVLSERAQHFAGVASHAYLVAWPGSSAPIGVSAKAETSSLPQNLSWPKTGRQRRKPRGCVRKGGLSGQTVAVAVWSDGRGRGLVRRSRSRSGQTVAVAVWSDGRGRGRQTKRSTIGRTTHACQYAPVRRPLPCTPRPRAPGARASRNRCELWPRPQAAAENGSARRTGALRAPDDFGRECAHHGLEREAVHDGGVAV
jgi:hypothetical protein